MNSKDQYYANRRYLNDAEYRVLVDSLELRMSERPSPGLFDPNIIIEAATLARDHYRDRLRSSNANSEANYLVLTTDGTLHAYVREDILRSHLAGNPKGEAVTIYRRITGLGTVHFVPLTPSEREAFERGEVAA
jgi:hypothetical protein